MKRVHLVISGDVIGVGYRSWAVRTARNLELTGWVKNREDGTVEATAEGSENALNVFVAACKKGPDVAWVKNVRITWGNPTAEFVTFSVVY